MRKLVKLSKVANYSDKRVKIENVSLENFITTDNLLQNKEGITLASNLPPQSGTIPAFKIENILIGNIRPYLKKIWFADRDGGCSADVLTLSVNKEYYPKYIYYTLFRDDFFDHMMRGSKGTKMPRGDKNQILDFLIPDFELSTQQKIANVLSALDAKIELNNRINAELEAMAKTLYDYWFVQFDFPDVEGKPYKTSGGAMVWNEELKREIPEGWEVGELKSMCNANQYQLNSSSNFSYVNYLDTSNITKNQIDNVILIDDLKNNLPSRAKRIVKKNDIIYSTVRPNQEHYGIIKEPVENMIVSTGFAVISHKKNTVLNDFIYCFLSNRITVDFLQTIADTSVSSYPSINVDDILNLKIALPKEDTLLIAISTQLSNFYQLIHKKQKENQQLSSLRDWLLPMLMNGQVVVE
ncbi:MAG: restriction endonuclease subunit S [Spirosomaceae bacterium]|jgi:type I restriction enzyme S subunit|nr:restriction endonuclease subunit S [Spirosomataceae bacterium]